MASGQEKTLEELIRELPTELRQEVEDFVEFLLAKRQTREQGSGKLKMDWAGGLREYRDKFTSIELQQKVLEWWMQGVQDEVSR
jgi:hypothetical protein